MIVSITLPPSFVLTLPASIPSSSAATLTLAYGLPQRMKVTACSDLAL
jgi:hypothetical protein